jgi:hypothetical protein
MRTGGAWCSRSSSTPKTGGKRSAACPSCARRWMPSRIPSTACSSTAVAAAGQVPGSRAGRSPRRARLPFRCPGPRTSRIWIWRLSPHRPPGRRRQGRYSGRRIHAVTGLAEMTLTDTMPVPRPSVRGTEELAAIGRSVTGRECLKRSHAPEPPICAGCCSVLNCKTHIRIRAFCYRMAMSLLDSGLLSRALTRSRPDTGLVVACLTDVGARR